MDDIFEHLSDDRLAAEITTWAGRVAAGEARLIGLIGEFDRREAWGGQGLLSCAHWLSWRLGMGLTAARERVRVANALTGLPHTAAAFGSGRLSWTQVRAITRVATADDEHTYVEVARHCTGAQLERLVRGVRRARKPQEDAQDPQRAAWKMRPRVAYDDDGTLVVTFRVPAQHGPVVLAGLERVQAQVQAELDAQRQARETAVETSGESSAETCRGSSAEASVPAPHPLRGVTLPLFDPLTPEQQAAVDTWHAGQQRASAEDSAPAAAPAAATASDAALTPVKATLTDAFVRLAQIALETPSPVRTDKSRLRVQLDPLSGWARTRDGELLPAGSLEPASQSRPGRSRLRRLQPNDLTAHDAGRACRHPSAALRQLLGTLDGERCRFPGCTRTANLHAQHVRHWTDGGRTDLANLALVCSRHHTLIHEHGFGLILHADRKLTVSTAQGVRVLHHPALPWRPAAELDPDRHVSAETLPPNWTGDRLDLHHAVWVLTQQAA